MILNCHVSQAKATHIYLHNITFLCFIFVIFTVSGTEMSSLVHLHDEMTHFNVWKQSMIVMTFEICCTFFFSPVYKTI